MLTLNSPIETPFHKLSVGIKLAALVVFSLVLLNLPNGWPVMAATVTMFALYLPGGWAFIRFGLTMLRPILPFVILIVLWDWAYGQILQGLMIALRMTILVSAANLLTMTSKLSDMLALFERLATPLRFVIPPKRLALALALVIRFIPSLGEIIARLRDAWRARSPRCPLWRLILPALLASLDSAEHSAEALKARGGIE